MCRCPISPSAPHQLNLSTNQLISRSRVFFSAPCGGQEFLVPNVLGEHAGARAQREAAPRTGAHEFATAVPRWSVIGPDLGATCTASRNTRLSENTYVVRTEAQVPAARFRSGSTRGHGGDPIAGCRLLDILAATGWSPRRTKVFQRWRPLNHCLPNSRRPCRAVPATGALKP